MVYKNHLKQQIKSIILNIIILKRKILLIFFVQYYVGTTHRVKIF